MPSIFYLLSSIVHPRSSILVAFEIMHFKHIAIVGVGLIGGSFALAARRAGIAERITGWDSDDVLDRARALGVIDDVESSFGDGLVCEADLVYLAAPVGAIVKFLRTRGSLLKAGTIVTDAGSTKREICRAAREALRSDVTIVGGHPMTGSEKTGVEFSDPDLFRDVAYVLVREGHKEALQSLADSVRALGAYPIVLTAEQHDYLVARVSHLPQILASALSLAVTREGGAEALALAASGFAEMTRLSQSKWSVWEDICRTNADEISTALDEMIAQIEAVRVALSIGDYSSVSEIFAAAGEATRRFHEVRRHQS